MPTMIRKQQIVNKILRLEEESEHLYQEFNSLERKYKKVVNRAERLWYILREYENKMYADRSSFQPQKRIFKNRS